MKKIRTITALLLAAAVIFSFSGCLHYTSNILEVTNADSTTESTSADVYTTVADTTVSYPDPTVTTTVPVDDVTTTAPSQSEAGDPSAWTVSQIVTYVNNAVNLTKAYTGSFTAKHTESITANITKAPGGTAIQNIINPIVEKIVKPTDETLNFSNGSAVNAEGETVQILLPKQGAFSIDEGGIASARAYSEGTDTVVEIQLISERGTLSTPPKYNASCIGYLDAGMLDITGVSITRVDVDYTGSKMKFKVNQDGYVVSAEYNVPYVIDGSGKAMFMSADIGCEGDEVECWTLNW